MNGIQNCAVQGMFIAPAIAAGAIVTGAITSIISQSAQPIAASAAISVLATVIGIVAGYIFRALNVAASNEEQAALAVISSGVAYTGLCIAGMVTGFMPGGWVGVAALIASLIISGLAFKPYVDCVAG